MRTVAVIGTLDTKGAELRYLKQRLAAHGCQSCVIDCGIVGPAPFDADYDNETVAAAGGSSISRLVALNDASKALEVMARGASAIVKQLQRDGRINGAIAVGGGQGTYLGMTAMSVLPFGFPKVMVSTLARAVKELFADAGDTVVLDPIVDIAGMNRILCRSMDQAAAIVASLTKSEQPSDQVERPVIAVSMFGVTNKCVDMVRTFLEQAGYEVWVFHSNGVGGANMEKLIRAGCIQGVADITTSEVGQTILGGTAACIPTRMEAAGAMGIPQVVSVGGIDHVNFLGMDSIPERYLHGIGRHFHMHNPSTTIMRSDARDYSRIGQIFAQKLNKAKGSVQVILPLRGMSEYDREGGVWYDPKADRVLYDAIEAALDPNIPVVELDCHINDDLFAQTVSEKMLEAMAMTNRKKQAIS